MAQLDIDAMLERFRGRAEAVSKRGLPPVAGEGRRALIEQAQRDYTDFALVGGAAWSVEDDHLVLRIPLAGG